jgi:hypothetical protein
LIFFIEKEAYMFAMFMLHFHAILALELIALALGAAILILAKAHESVGTCFAKMLGYIVVVISLLSVLCSLYGATMFWLDGHGKLYPMMMQGQKMGGQMMSGQTMGDQGGQGQMIPAKKK